MAGPPLADQETPEGHGRSPAARRRCAPIEKKPNRCWCQRGLIRNLPPGFPTTKPTTSCARSRTWSRIYPRAGRWIALCAAMSVSARRRLRCVRRSLPRLPENKWRSSYRRRCCPGSIIAISARALRPVPAAHRTVVAPGVGGRRQIGQGRPCRRYGRYRDRHARAAGQGQSLSIAWAWSSSTRNSISASSKRNG